jgi:hypothetical protein
MKHGAIKGKDKFPWRVLTSSPIIQKKKVKAKHRNNNFEKIFANQISAILIKMTSVNAVNNIRVLLCNNKGMRLDKMLNLRKVAF